MTSPHGTTVEEAAGPPARTDGGRTAAWPGQESGREPVEGREEEAAGTPVRTLYCLAHAGGSALPYARWSAALPPGVRVEPLELPGHGSRLREPLLTDLEAAVAEVLERVRPEEGPFALFGHSFGALLGFEAARRLSARGTPPAALLAAGRNGPGEPLSHRPLHTLPDDRFVAAVHRMGGLPDILMEQPEVLRMYLPALRCDLRLVETYVRAPGPPLDVPVAAFGGRGDVLTDPAGLLAWQKETSGPFQLALLPGGHFFVTGPPFLRALCAALTGAAAPAAPAP
ncbi:alpha/beta fold hydrolase [Streptomyces sp. TRM 70351]|uniref:thioesterase II family protein n=1 Tax=Streptomyces sp. TRM 70351 TaxID=3116552 RepID=UPI002E7BBBD7|nr:alpha/beta fold hydrolase [Streptomyces sp. TRM 70351]MEE1931087.1 alpha/beta fold hydrolase [Streptomyces sp. TRM 70351]